jgi:hypothetical protein
MPTSRAALKDLAKAKWQSSGIEDDAARLLKLKALTAEEVVALHDRFHPVGAMLLPYFNLDGSTSTFYRVRYLEPLPGFAGAVEKPQRYAQAPGTLNEVYLPPLLKDSWATIAQNPSTAICITEGELKAASATGHGYPTIGLGGVDVWRSGRRGIDLLPQLKEIKWQGRDVVIIFDSDAAVNPAVTAAQRRLAKELVARGALPRIAAIPGGLNGAKVGLDDYLVKHGPEALQAVVEAAPAYAEGEALWALNEEVAYARDPGIVIERESGRRIDPGSFVRHVYANRHYVEQQVTPAGKIVLKKKSLAARWVEWEHRFEVDRIVYEPGKPRLYEGAWNAWKGWGAEEKQGPVELWDRLLDFMFKGDDGARKWFEQWCAYPIQHPGTKLYTSCLLWSAVHGTGKSLLAYLLKAVYGNNAIEIDSDALRSSFNAWAENKQFVIGDEITAGDARLDKDKLKSIVTRPVIRINQKYLPEYVIRDSVNYLFTSNAPDALFVEDNDRRYFVQEVVGAPLPREFYEKCDQWLHGEAGANLLYHLRRVDLTGFNPREHAYVTASKRSMIFIGKSELAAWMAEMMEDPKTKLRALGEDVARDCELFPANVILRCFDPEGHKRCTPNTVAKELQRLGLRPLNGGVPVRTKAGTVRLYAIRNHDEWVSRAPRLLAAHYEKFLLDNQKF